MKETKNKEKDSIIKSIIVEKGRPSFEFKPTLEFYNVVGIKRKRFAKMFRGEVSPTIDELVAICKYFNSNISKFIN